MMRGQSFFLVKGHCNEWYAEYHEVGISTK